LSKLFNIGIFKGGNHLDFVTFYDVGHANDTLDDLYDKSKYSKGVGFNIVLKKAMLKLQTANGSDNSKAWFLAFGKRY